MASKKERQDQGLRWVVVERPSYLDKLRGTKEAEWNEKYGEANWRYAWELRSGEVLDFERVFWEVYVAGYVKYFYDHPEEAIYLTDNFSFAYDKEEITIDQAFDLYALYNQPGHANQFHNVALNIALTSFLGLPFKGSRPIQVREEKPGTPVEHQPEGYLWSPGRIAAVRPDLIPKDIEGWWRRGSIEDLYQSAKVIQIKTS